MSSAFEMQFPTDDTEVGLHPSLSACVGKVITADEAALKIRNGQRVFVGTACATPRSLVAALEALPKWPADVELLHFLTDHALPHGGAGLGHRPDRPALCGSVERPVLRRSGGAG